MSFNQYFRYGFWLLFALCYNIRILMGSCAQLNNCNGHGQCIRYGVCKCQDGWGSASDNSTIKANDCSLRICPSGTAWADLAHYDGSAHNLAECSNAGLCNRKSGQCECFPGFTGSACQRRSCLNDCSGHGRCVSKQQAARMPGALPVNRDSKYGERTQSDNNTVWDALVEFVCICDSSWDVGSDRGQRSDSEWFGPDCSLRHCPSANNPATLDIDETSCWNQSQPLNGLYPGREGSLCQVDCAGQGICDYKTGICSCFRGYVGVDCGRRADDNSDPVPIVEYVPDDDYIPYTPPEDDDHDLPIQNTIIK